MVRWLRAPEENEFVRGDRKVLAIFLAFVLTLTVIGMIPLIFGTIIWKKQSQALKQSQRLLAEGKPSAEKIVESPLVKSPIDVAKAKRTLVQPYTFNKTTVFEIAEKMDRIVAVNPKYGKVGLEEVTCHGLFPRNKISVDGVNFYCSDLFKLDDGHYHVLAFIEVDNKLYPRLFYHSNSQGTWRVMPYADKRGPEREIVWYGKGQCESDTQLPIPLICALNQLDYVPAKVTPYAAGKVVESIVADRRHSFLDKVGIAPSVVLEEGASKKCVTSERDLLNPPDPRSIRLPDDLKLHPDFSAEVPHFRQVVPHYGIIKVKIVPSKDKTLRYMFYEAEDGRAFLASVECVQGASINSFGVRDKIISLKGMDAPLLEYSSQISPGYKPEALEENRYISKKYQSNWNFVRELEIIQMYYREQKREVPPRV